MKTKEICYKTHERTRRSCLKRDCRYNVDFPACQNCVLIASEQKRTLQDVGDVYGVTRMRICQIEKRALAKLGELAEHFK